MFVFVSHAGDLIIVVLHRIYYPISGEGFVGTYHRLKKPWQHWPALQSDGGKAYQKEKDRIEGRFEE